MKRSSFIVILVLGTLGSGFAVGDAIGQEKAPVQKRKSSTRKSVQVATEAPKDAPLENRFTPSRTFAPGTVGSYFFPREVGGSWKMRTISSYFSPQRLSDGSIVRKVLASDTAFAVETVKSNDFKSLQRMPLVIFTDSAYHVSGGASQVQESQYYVDDSLILAVFNNSMLSGDNRILLMSPLREGAGWNEQRGDTTLTVITGLDQRVETPFSSFEGAVETTTSNGRMELKKYFAPGFGIVKTVLKAPGKYEGDQIVVTSELVDVWNVQGHGRAEAGVSGSTADPVPVEKP